MKNLVSNKIGWFDDGAFFSACIISRKCGPRSLNMSAVGSAALTTSRMEPSFGNWCLDVLTSSFFSHFQIFIQGQSLPTSFSKRPHLVLHLNLMLKQNVRPTIDYFKCAQIEAVCSYQQRYQRLKLKVGIEAEHIRLQHLTTHHFCLKCMGSKCFETIHHRLSHPFELLSP